MDDIVCEICIKEYNIDVIVPRVLNCGHTICSSCITQILQTSGSCPKCRVAMTCGSSSNYPINYSFLRMVDFLKNDVTLQTFLQQRRLNILTRKYVSLENKLTEASLVVISAKLARIQELFFKDDESVDDNSYNQTILTLNKQLEDLCSRNTLNYAKLKSSTALNLCSFQEPIEFLRELQEIKNCLTTVNVQALLEISCNDAGIRHMIVIKPSNSSLVPQFLKYCTGEIGPAYKGTTYTQGSDSLINLCNASSVLTVDKCNVNGVDEDGNFEYVSTLGSSCKYTANELIVIGKRNGGFQIVHLINHVNLTDAIGVIKDPLDLHLVISHGNNRKVTDSGIIINL